MAIWMLLHNIVYCAFVDLGLYKFTLLIVTSHHQQELINFFFCCVRQRPWKNHYPYIYLRISYLCWCTISCKQKNFVKHKLSDSLVGFTLYRNIYVAIPLPIEGAIYSNFRHSISVCSSWYIVLKLVKTIVDGEYFWIGLDLCNDDTRPSGHISRPTQVNVSQSCFNSLIKLLKLN